MENYLNIIFNKITQHSPSRGERVIMEIRMTIKELMDRGLWDEYCKLTGTNEWAVNEGLILSSETVLLPHELEKNILEAK